MGEFVTGNNFFVALDRDLVSYKYKGIIASITLPSTFSTLWVKFWGRPSFFRDGCHVLQNNGDSSSVGHHNPEKLLTPTGFGEWHLEDPR